MTTSDDRLREALDGIAGAVAPTDLYERSLRRSRGIGRRRSTAGVGAALVALGLLGGGLWQLPPPGGGPVTPPAASRPATPDTTIAAVPGTLFYARADDPARVLRLRPGGAPVEVLTGHDGGVAVSPDGRSLAWVTSGGDVMVAAGGAGPRRVAQGAADSSALSWSPASDRLLLTRGTQPGTVDVATGRNFRYSGDGTRLVYGVDPCRLRVAGAAGDAATTVPVIGDPESARNPSGVAACAPASVDAAGTRAVIAPQGGAAGGPSGEPATAVVDLATGAVLPAPVPGEVQAVVFHPAGALLVRSVRAGATLLTVQSPAGAVLVEAPEPAAVRGLDLIAWTH